MEYSKKSTGAITWHDRVCGEDSLSSQSSYGLEQLLPDECVPEKALLSSGCVVSDDSLTIIYQNL
jgi:hypothetical protein